MAVRLSRFRVPSCIRVPKDVPYLLPKRLGEKSVNLRPPAFGEVLSRLSGFLTLLRDGFPALGDPLDVNTRQERRSLGSEAPQGWSLQKPTLLMFHKTFEVPQVHFIEKDTVDVHVVLQREMLVFQKFRNRGIPTSRYTELAVRFSRYAETAHGLVFLRKR